MQDFAGMRERKVHIWVSGQDDDSGGVLPMRSSVCCAVMIILYRDSSDNNSLDQAKQVPHITTALLADEHCRVLTAS
jgi:hypothetical protein